MYYLFPPSLSLSPPLFSLSSRLLLGALVHSHAILIIDSSLSDANQLTSFLDAVKLFLKEQVSAIVKFNIIRYAMNVYVLYMYLLVM